jgi:hypothetical protein
MDRQLAAWRSHVGKLLVIAETIPGKDPATDAKQIENLQSLIADIGSVSNLLKKECLPA